MKTNQYQFVAGCVASSALVVSGVHSPQQSCVRGLIPTLKHPRPPLGVGVRLPHGGRVRAPRWRRPFVSRQTGEALMVRGGESDRSKKSSMPS